MIHTATNRQAGGRIRALAFGAGFPLTYGERKAILAAMDTAPHETPSDWLLGLLAQQERYVASQATGL